MLWSKILTKIIVHTVALSKPLDFMQERHIIQKDILETTQPLNKLSWQRCVSSMHLYSLLKTKQFTLVSQRQFNVYWQDWINHQYNFLMDHVILIHNSRTPYK